MQRFKEVTDRLARILDPEHEEHGVRLVAQRDVVPVNLLLFLDSLGDILDPGPQAIAPCSLDAHFVRGGASRVEDQFSQSGTDLHPSGAGEAEIGIRTDAVVEYPVVASRRLRTYAPG